MGSAKLRTGVCGAALFWGAILAAAPAVAPRADDDTPGVRNAHALAYDGRVALLFGGATDSAVVGDTWGWDGKDWRRLAAGGPPPRTFPAMAGDGVSRAFLFGGSRVLFGDDSVAANRDAAQALFADTWSWDGTRWTEVTGTQPPARAEAAAAWDPKRKRMVLFGGYTWKDGRRERLQDTWEFNGQAWARFSTTGPSARSGAAMAFDPELGQVVLFGGSGATNDTWIWDGTAWSEAPAPTPPPGRFNAAMAGPATGSILRFGGWDGQARTADTWRLRGGLWSAVKTGDSPPARNHAAMTHDTKRDCFVLFGGHDGASVFGDVWERCGSGNWKRVAKTGPRERVPNNH
jgi:hypothetical protein